MSDTNIKDELASLLRDTTEHLAYLRELGATEIAADLGSPELETSQDSNAQRGTLNTGDTTFAVPKANQTSALLRNAAEATRREQTPFDAHALRAKSTGDSVTSPPRTFAPRIAPSPLKQTSSDTANRFSTSTQSSLIPSNDMAKKSTHAPAATPAPQETLFGEVTPRDEASLPRTDETLEDIRRDIGDCTRCPLYEGRTQVVHSEGNRQARLMFVGEAPGADEDASGRPFVGRAGQLLNKIVEAIGLKREDVFIGNVNRCRPPQNRTPTPQEAKTCKPFLLREIAIVQPDVIVVLGNTAMKNLLDTKEGITKIRGTFQDYKGIKVMPTFHPAYLLRDPSKKRETWEDMKTVRDYLQRNPRKNEQPESVAQSELGLDKRDEDKPHEK